MFDNLVPLDEDDLRASSLTIEPYILTKEDATVRLETLFVGPSTQNGIYYFE